MEQRVQSVERMAAGAAAVGGGGETPEGVGIVSFNSFCFTRPCPSDGAADI